MIKLQIINIKNYVYELKDTEEKKYIMNLEFFDIKEKPKVGDYLYIASELLNAKYEGYSTFYTFGDLESKYGKENISPEDIDVIKVEMDKKEILLKRLYG